MLAMSLFLLHSISLFLLAVLFPASHAFEFDLPSSIPTNEPITVGYRMKFDGSDETTWLMNITDVDGSNPEILNDGQLFERPFTRFFGSIQVTIDREGPFRLKAVNPEFLRQSYATSSPGFAIDFDPDDPVNEGSGTDPRDDGHDENTNGDETEDEPGDGTGGTSGNGSGSGDGDSDGDDDGETGSGSGNGNGSGSGSETDPDEDPEDVTTSASPKSSTSPSTATRRPSNVPNGPIGASKRGANTGLIAGCIAAGVAALLLVLAVLFWLRRSNNRSKPGRPLTFYRDRMIRAPTPPPNEGPPPPVHISEPMSVIQNPHDYGHAGMAYLPGYGNTYPAYGQPHSASTAVGPPVMREFILRSPRMPASPSQPQLKEFILRSPRPGRESLAYSKP